MELWVGRHVTNTVVEFTRACFVIELQPDCIIRKSVKFKTLATLLIGRELGLMDKHKNLPQVMCQLVDESNAKLMYVKKRADPRGDIVLVTAGEVDGNTGAYINSDAEGTLVNGCVSFAFSGMRLSKLKREKAVVVNDRYDLPYVLA